MENVKNLKTNIRNRDKLRKGGAGEENIKKSKKGKSKNIKKLKTKNRKMKKYNNKKHLAKAKGCRIEVNQTLFVLFSFSA